MSTSLSLRQVHVFAPDLQAARHFYGEILGLTLQSDRDQLLEFSGTDFDLMVFQCETSSNSSNYSRQAGLSVAFSVRSLEASMLELSRKGVRFLHDSPEKGPTGQRYVAFVDPFGTVFELVELTESR